ncbi:MAG: GDSL-type esterase/lipase family protein [Acidobacteria bacterium]|nr:GDSL-type esterase/lipase family protein [Acidobacteriota bacterium]
MRPRRFGSPVPLTAALVTASTILALAFGEGVTRLLGLAPGVSRIVVDQPDSPLQLSEDPLQVYELKPGFSSAAHPEFRTNAQGLRGPDRAIPKPSGVFRVVLLGDSVVEGIGVDREADTVASQLEGMLAEDGVEVLNAGVRGYNTQAAVTLLRRRVLPYDPDLVILVFVRNDHQSLNRNVGASWEYPRPRWSEILFAYSHLFRASAFYLNWFHFREDLDPDYLQERMGRSQARDNVAAGLEELARLSDGNSFRALVVVWPNFGSTVKDPPGLFEPHSDRLRVETLAARYVIPVVRLSTAFMHDYARRGPGHLSPRELYTTDGMHPNPEGAKVAATILEELIRKQRLVER